MDKGFNKSNFFFIQIGLDPKKLHAVKTSYIPRAVNLLRIFYSLYWITEQRVTPAPANAMYVFFFLEPCTKSLQFA